MHRYFKIVPRNAANFTVDFITSCLLINILQSEYLNIFSGMYFEEKSRKGWKVVCGNLRFAFWNSALAASEQLLTRDNYDISCFRISLFGEKFREKVWDSSTSHNWVIFKYFFRKLKISLDMFIPPFFLSPLEIRFLWEEFCNSSNLKFRFQSSKQKWEFWKDASAKDRKWVISSYCLLANAGCPRKLDLLNNFYTFFETPCPTRNLEPL